MKRLAFISLLALAACARPLPAQAPEPKVPEAIVEAVIEVESRGKPGVVSSSGCVGLMQVLPSTGRALGYTRADLLDPVKNREAGTKYLEMMLDLCGGDLPCALASYNKGYGRRHLGREYARRVLIQRDKK